MNIDPYELAFKVTNQIPAMVAFWNYDQKCVYSNDAYREWFGKSPTEMIGMTLNELLGPIYTLNLPFILGALGGEKQVFERQIRLPDGTLRDSIATYTPEIVNGRVLGFSVHVADVTTLREREAALQLAIEQRDAALAEAQILRGILPTCSFCKSIRDENGQWHSMETYIDRHTAAKVSHGLCPTCAEQNYPDYFPKTND